MNLFSTYQSCFGHETNSKVSTGMQSNRHRKAAIFLDCNNCEWIPYVTIYIKKLVLLLAYYRILSIRFHLFVNPLYQIRKK